MVHCAFEARRRDDRDVSALQQVSFASCYFLFIDTYRFVERQVPETFFRCDARESPIHHSNGLTSCLLSAIGIKFIFKMFSEWNVTVRFLCVSHKATDPEEE